MKSLFIRFNILVLLALVTVRFGISPMIERYAIKTLHKQLDQYTESILRGPYYVTVKYLESVSDEDIPEILKSLKKEFGFPIDMVSLNSLEISDLKRQALEKGKIVSADEWSVFYKRFGNSYSAIKMGPIKDFEEIIPVWQFEVMTWVTVICFVALLSLMWAFPFWRNLKQIMDAADHFGSGRFNIRARLGRRSALKPMAETFNNMAERIEALMRSEKLLVNAVSHEFRTPISRMRFGMEMLLSSENNEDAEKYISGISEDIDDLDSLVSELLTYAVFERDSEFFHVEDIEPEKWFFEIVSRIEPFLGDKNIEINIAEDLSLITGDSKFLARAVENLILNAVRYSKSKIRIEALKNGENTRVSIIDDGPGILIEDREKIFQPFVRLDESRSRESGGYGLGLAIVKQVMEKHGGRVFVESSAHGATFVIEW